MILYLDWNIIVSLNHKAISLSDIYTVIGTNDIIIPYSPAHIQELDNIYAVDQNQRKKLILEHISTIRNITNSMQIYHELYQKKVFYGTYDPEEVLKTINEFPIAKNAINVFTNLFGRSTKDRLRETYGLNPQELNNYPPEEVIEHLNRKSEIFENKSFIEFIDYTFSFYPDTQFMGIHNKISAIFELLDILGYWKDKDTNKSGVARLWDSNHTYYACHCDYFITNDKRTRNKAKVVYHIYDISTKVIPIKLNK